MQKRILGLYWKIALRHKRLFWVNIVSTPVTLVLERYVAPLAIAAIFQMIQNGDISLEKTGWLLVAYGSIQFYTQVIGYRIGLYAYWRMSSLGMADLYKLCFETFTKQSARFYGDEFEGALVARATRFTNAFEAFWSTFIYQFLFLTTSIIATMVGVGLISWPYMLILLFLTVLFMVIAYHGNKKMRSTFEERSEATSTITAQFADSISNILAIKAESSGKIEARQTEKIVKKWSDIDKSAMRQFLTFSSVFAAIISLMKVLSLVTAVILVQSNQINAGLVYLLITFTINLIEEVWNFNNFFRNYTGVLADAREMVKIIDQPIEVIDTTQTDLVVRHGDISIKDIAYTHPEQQDNLFENLTLHIKAGEKIGLIGRSGSGKTTLTNLLMRFMDSDKGIITIDNQDIKEVRQDSLRQSIAYVSQDPLLFHRSIRENISYSKPDATEKQIIEAAKKAHVWEFVNQLPEKMDTLVGERGVKLSGGQRQRIAIARAILKNAPIIILDEATSALDSESEKLIQDALKKLMKKRTSIVIAHRLSTIAHLNRIVVLDKGKIAEQGSHEELVKKKGIYAKLWSHQSGGFIDE